MEFIETGLFTNLIFDYLSEDQYKDFQLFLAQHPGSGDIIKDSGGIRKVRWKLEKKGKSGGVRVIYYWKRSDDEIWLLTLYKKSEQANISKKALKQIAKELKNV
jgi:hypothetical protein